MTLDQCLGTVAWLFIAFLMYFSTTKYDQCHEGYGDDMYWLMMRVGMKPVFSVEVFLLNIAGQSLFYAVMIAIWVMAVHSLYITYIGG